MRCQECAAAYRLCGARVEAARTSSLAVGLAKGAFMDCAGGNGGRGWHQNRGRMTQLHGTMVSTRQVGRRGEVHVVYIVLVDSGAVRGAIKRGGGGDRRLCWSWGCSDPVNFLPTVVGLFLSRDSSVEVGTNTERVSGKVACQLSPTRISVLGRITVVAKKTCLLGIRAFFFLRCRHIADIPK